MRTITTDVAVVGCGIAGLCAAHGALESGAGVVVVSQGRACSGSSFSGTTWGLGVVGPKTREAADIDDFVAAVLRPAGGRGSEHLVRALAEGFHDAVDSFRSMGAVIEDVPEGHGSDRAYVPCFDTDVRGWHGFHAPESAAPLTAWLRHSPATVLERHEVLSLLTDRTGAVRGVLAFPLDGGEPVAVTAGSTVLAVGGMAAARTPTLASPECRGTAASMAADAGATTGNTRFEQRMAGIPTPSGPVVFNEKLWRGTRLLVDGRDLFETLGVAPEQAREALEAHSWHGPYSVQRPSRLVEESIEAVGGACEAVIDEPDDGTQPFIATYMDWLKERCGHGFGDPMPIEIYHQASNGGIRIDDDGSCRVPGLYAAGECAPIFAEDRLGGIASATAMVFGLAAGRSAALHGIGPLPADGCPVLDVASAPGLTLEKVTAVDPVSLADTIRSRHRRRVLTLLEGPEAPTA